MMTAADTMPAKTVITTAESFIAFMKSMTVPSARAYIKYAVSLSLKKDLKLISIHTPVSFSSR